MVDEQRPRRWQDLTGADRWEVIQQARRKEIPVVQLCRMFGITRQTLYRAMEAADQAAQEALAPKPPGRKKKPVSETQIQELQQQLTSQEKELARWQQKYEVLQTLRQLEQKLARGERLPGEERKKRRRRK
jgi:flagellar motility protein MotE (MotC chaperone)